MSDIELGRSVATNWEAYKQEAHVMRDMLVGVWRRGFPEDYYQSMGVSPASVAMWSMPSSSKAVSQVSVSFR